MTYTAHSDSGFHDIGKALSDRKPCGSEMGRRPADLFPHDGRISDLLQAILQHQSAGSKANMVIYNFTALSKDPAAASAEMSERSPLADCGTTPGLSRRQDRTGRCRRSAAALGAIGGDAGLGALVGGLAGAAAGGLASRNRVYAGPSPFCF